MQSSGSHKNLSYTFSLMTSKMQDTKKRHRSTSIQETSMLGQPMWKREVSLLDDEIVQCHRCARLIAWCESISREKVKRFSSEEYWGKPVPSFGDIQSELLLVGLAPAAHGANRTGRLFTGDRSGEWLFDALYKHGFCSEARSVHRDDGVRLINCRITAVAHCAPPQNKLLKEEIDSCSDFLARELLMMQRLKVVITFGKVAFDSLTRRHFPQLQKSVFRHGAELRTEDGKCIIASYHPSQQNTFTGKLTRNMFYQIFQQSLNLLKSK